MRFGALSFVISTYIVTVECKKRRNEKFSFFFFLTTFQMLIFLDFFLLHCFWTNFIVSFFANIFHSIQKVGYTISSVSHQHHTDDMIDFTFFFSLVFSYSLYSVWKIIICMWIISFLPFRWRRKLTNKWNNNKIEKSQWNIFIWKISNYLRLEYFTFYIEFQIFQWWYVIFIVILILAHLWR